MPLMRNPFSKRVPGDVVSDEAASPKSDATGKNGRPHPGTIDVCANGQPEYKLSEINDSGVFLPPSPTTEKPRFWTSRSQSSATTASSRSAATDNDNPFTISRESFDSYRRSFDISARSPVMSAESQRTRHSLDHRRFRMPLPALSDNHFNPPEAQPEERFEDVGLNDELEAARPKRNGIFSRFAHSTHDPYQMPAPPSEISRPGSSHFGAQLFGRRRAASNSHSAEMGNMSQATDKTPQDAKKE